MTYDFLSFYFLFYILDPFDFVEDLATADIAEPVPLTADAGVRDCSCDIAEPAFESIPDICDLAVDSMLDTLETREF